MMKIKSNNNIGAFNAQNRELLDLIISLGDTLENNEFHADLKLMISIRSNVERSLEDLQSLIAYDDDCYVTVERRKEHRRRTHNSDRINLHTLEIKG